MVIIAILLISLSLIACGAAAGDPPPAQKGASGEPEILVSEPFARASVPNGAVYMTLTNSGGSDDALLSAETDVAEAVELHESMMDENDVMRMSPIENVKVPAGSSATLEPGGKHVMLINLQQQLSPGDMFSLTLNFERSGAKTIEVEVREGMTINHDEMEENMDENMEGDESMPQ